MTERELICLRYLDDKMEATARMVGEEIVRRVSSRHRGGSNYSAVGANVLGALRQRQLVARLPELNAWRITALGRGAITHQP
jgi:hypothetical protein